LYRTPRAARVAHAARAKTDSDFCFAVAGVEGELTTAYYADVDPPGPYGVDPRWVPAVDQPPDWDGE